MAGTLPKVVTRHPAVGAPHERGIRRDEVLGDMQPRAEGLLPGDFILVRSHSKVAPRLIGFGQRLHHDPAFAYWTHAAVYVGKRAVHDRMLTDETRPEGEVGRVVSQGHFEETLIEAKGGERVRYVPLSQYDVRDYAAVRFSHVPGDTRRNAIKFCESRLGRGYGYLTIVTLALWSVFGGKITLGLSGADVCSGLVAQATMYLGEIYDGDPVTVEPATLAEKYGIRR